MPLSRFQAVEFPQLPQLDEKLLNFADSLSPAQVASEFFHLGQAVVVLNVQVRTFHLHYPLMHCKRTHSFGAVGAVAAW